MKIKYNNTLKYYEGDIRIVKKFLFFPVDIKNEIRWLEFAQIKQECIGIHINKGFFRKNTYSYVWRNLDWA